MYKSKIRKEQWVINLTGTSAKSKIIAEHQAKPHDQTAVPSSDGITNTTIMTQPVQAPPPQTIQIEDNNRSMDEHAGWGSNAPTAEVSFSQTHAHLSDWILLESQSSIDYFTNPSLVNNVHDSKEILMLSTYAGQSLIEQKANVPKWIEVWFNKNGIVKEWNFKHFQPSPMIKHHTVTFDSDKDEAFLVHA